MAIWFRMPGASPLLFPANWKSSNQLRQKADVSSVSPPEKIALLTFTKAAQTLSANGSMKYRFATRGGAVALEMYEYDTAGHLVTEHVFAKSAPNPASDSEWQDIKGYYRLPPGIANTSLAIVINEGCHADLDGVRFYGFERSPEMLNVRDYGVSGSSFETTASTTAGSSSISVKDVGDFEVGAEIAVFNCKPHFTNGLVWDASGNDHREVNFNDQVELRGYDGSAGDRASYILDFSGESPPSFRWSNNLGQRWKEPIQVTGDWQKLTAGIEVKLPNKEFWTKPRLVSFTARNHLISQIIEIGDRTLKLAHPALLAAKECVVQHSDSGPLQRAFDRAAGEQRNLFIPSGHYRLSTGLILHRPNGILIEGENKENTILDTTMTLPRTPLSSIVESRISAAAPGTSITISSVIVPS